MKFKLRLTAAAVLLCAAMWWTVDRAPVKSAGPARQVSLARRTMDPKRSHTSSVERLAPRADESVSRKMDASTRFENPDSISNPAKSADAVNQEDATVGVRLASDVRLPATSFAVDPDLFASPEIAMANQEIENRFYRELLDQTLQTLCEHSGPEVPPDGTEEIPIDENGEKTMIVQPGADTDRALDRSDEAFRSLFGNDAYNRRKMDGALELGASNTHSGD